MRAYALALVAMLAVGLVSGRAGAQDTPGGGAPPPTGIDAEAARRKAQEILRGPEYPFCNDDSRFVRPSEIGYCGFVDERSDCPAFAKACERMSAKPPSCACNRVGAQSRVGNYLALLSLGAFVLALIFLVVRGLIRARRAEGLVDRAVEAPEHPSLVPIPSATPGELFARALEAHSRGDQRAALYNLYAALLRKLEERGAVRIDPAFTNGDYVRQCRESELRTPLRETVRAVDRARFGGAEPEGNAIAALIQRLEPIVRAAGALILVFGVAGALAGCGKLARPGGTGGTADASATGHRAVRTLLADSAVRTEILSGPPEDVKDTNVVLVVDGDRIGLDEKQWASVMDWVSRGGRLLVAGGIREWPDVLQVHPAHQPEAGAEVTLDRVLGGATVKVEAGALALAAPIPGYVVATYSDGAAYAALIEHGSGRVLAVGGSELFTNGGIAVNGNAAGTIAFARLIADGRELRFVESATGGPSNPLVSLARAGLLPAVLQGLLALALFYLLMGRFFGTPRDRAANTRRAFAEHVRAVGGLYARAALTRPPLRAYATLVLERIRERVAVGRGSLAEAVAARVGDDRAEVERVIEAVEHARADESTGSAPDDLRLIKTLNRWYRSLG